MIETLIDRVIVREGGYCDIPEDRGGPTKYGITIYTLSSWRNEMCEARDVQDMSVMEARDIYRSMYWTEARLDELDISPVMKQAVDEIPRGLFSLSQKAVICFLRGGNPMRFLRQLLDKA